MQRVRDAENALGQGTKLTDAVARGLFKLMAIKDEYEVARLYTSGDFEKRLQETFEGDFTLKFSLEPPIFAKKDEQGRLLKAQYGGWVWHAFKLLARMKRIRGTAFDVFGNTADRKTERALIEEYRALIERVLPQLRPQNLALAIEMARVPETIRGFGHVKHATVEEARNRWRASLARFEQRALAADAA